MSDNYNYSKIYILYTGGTIGMGYDDSKGLIPIKGKLTKLIENLKIKENLNIDYKIERTSPLIDSSNLNTSNWKTILEKLYENYNKYDSFIIIHGTDTLAYTASALSFFLKDWNKTVIVTGSQIPLFEFRSDAKVNLLDSITVSLHKIPEVLVVFGRQVIRGNRSTKISSTNFKAYDSPNFPILGNINVNIKLKNYLFDIEKQNKSILPYKLPNIPSNWNLTKWNDNEIKIYELRLLPIDNSIPLKNLIDLKPNAIILQTYGIGNAPVGNEKFMKQLKLAINKNILVVNITQCPKGGVNMDYYNTGKLLKKIGVVGGLDMTFECVFGKLLFLFQVIGENNVNLIKKVLQTNICGELSNNTKNKKISNRLKKFFKNYQEI
jgi:L-asparaginase